MANPPPQIQHPSPVEAPEPEADLGYASYTTTPDATLAELIHRFPTTATLPESATIGQAVDHLNHYPTHAGLVVEAYDGKPQLICRERLFQSLAQNFAFEVFNKRTIREYLEINKHKHEHLSLPVKTSVTAAITQALARNETERYDPFLIDDPLNGPVVADIRILIDHQRTQLSETLQVVEDHSLLAEHHANHDLLTGLANRHAMLRQLAHALEAPQSERPVTALLIMDFKHFKLINESLGHEAGDLLLIQIAERLETVIREFKEVHPQTLTVIARQSGDEFGILLAHLPRNDPATHLAQHILGVMQKPFSLQGQEVYSSPFIGFSTTAISGNDPAHLLRDADTAMDCARRSINTPCVTFEPGQRARSLERLQMEVDLRHAVTQNRIHAAYQPILAAEHGRIVGFEALCRWNHPEFGEVPANRFIPIAEQTGLISPISQSILGQAIRHTADWRSRFPEHDLFVSVNLALRQVLSPDFTDHVFDLLDTHGLPANRLVLELSEAALVEHHADTHPVVEQLHDAGIQIAMDSFGGGNPALTKLHTLPLSVVKIDRQLVAQLDGVSPYAAVVDALVAVTKRLGMTVAMKCIEGPAQIVQAQTVGCDLLQGYHLAPPVAADQVATTLDNAELHPALR